MSRHIIPYDVAVLLDRGDPDAEFFGLFDNSNITRLKGDTLSIDVDKSRLYEALQYHEELGPQRYKVFGLKEPFRYAEHKN